MIEKNGFVIDKIYDYDRPTVLKDGEWGLVNWMKQFYVSELAVLPENVQATVCERVGELTRGYSLERRGMGCRLSEIKSDCI